MSRSLWPGIDPPTTRPPPPRRNRLKEAMYTICSRFAICSFAGWGTGRNRWWVGGLPWPPSPKDIAKLKAGPEYKLPMNPRVKGGPRRTPEKQLLFDTVKGILKGLTEPMKFGDLFERVQQAGVPIGGTNERQNFSVFIAKFSCFQSVGRGEGWRYLPERDFEPLPKSPPKKHV
jgi:hypothetical protein